MALIQENRKQPCLKQSILLQLILILVSSLSFAECKTTEKIIASITATKQYRLGSEIDLVLSEKQAVRLKIADDLYGFDECILYWENSEASGPQLYTLCFDNQENLLNQGSTSLRLIGALRQVGQLPYLTIATWNKQNEKVFVHFCISSDRVRNRLEYEKVKNLQQPGKIKMAIQIRNMEAVIGRSELTKSEVLVGFIKLWSEVKYNFVFFGRLQGLDWDDVLSEYLPKVQQAESVEEYYRILKKMMALLKDGHTDVSSPSGEFLYSLPLEICSINGKAIIIKIASANNIVDAKLKAMLIDANLKPGEEITRVNDRFVKEILDQDVYPYISASTPQARDLIAYPKLLIGENNTEVKLHVRGLDGIERQIKLTRGTVRPESQKNDFLCQELSTGFFYINLPGFNSEYIVKQFDKVFPQILHAKGLILDVRENGGGNSSFGDSIISYLTDKPLEGCRWKTRQYMPAFHAWSQEEKWYEGKSEIYPRKQGVFTRPIVVLTGPATCSAAENFVVALHAAKRVTVVGERTNGSTGQPLFINLPKYGIARICTKWDFYPDGREFVGIGIIPDIEVQLKPADIATGGDVVLQEGLKTLKFKVEQYSMHQIEEKEK